MSWTRPVGQRLSLNLSGFVDGGSQSMRRGLHRYAAPLFVRVSHKNDAEIPRISASIDERQIAIQLSDSIFICYTTLRLVWK